MNKASDDLPQQTIEQEKERKIRVSALLTNEEAELFEAWRQQHSSGQGYISQALRSLIGIYLGVKGWPPNAPGFGSAWEKTLGWNLEDPRSPGNSGKSTKLRLV